MKMKLFILFVVAAFLVLATIACGNGDKGVSKVDACVACDAFVKRMLVAPSTADFPPTSKMSIIQAGNNFTVTGYVDAENSFGAMVRTRFICDVTYKGGGVDRLSNWHLEDLVFLE